MAGASPINANFDGWRDMSSHAVEKPAATTARLEAFSDGVFAIAITLLIFGIKVPAILSAAARAS